MLLSRGERDVIGLRFQKLWWHVVVIFSVIVSYAFVRIHVLSGLEYPKKRKLLWLAQEQLKTCVHRENRSLTQPGSFSLIILYSQMFVKFSWK